MKLCVECNIHFSEDLTNCPNDGTQLIVVGDDALIGELVGDKYRILCHAGKGSMSVVYKAIQESTGREMAVKMLHQFLGAKEESVKRFFREAKAVSSLHHTNIIKLYDFGVMPDGQPYIVTEFLDGMTLTELLKRRGQLTVKEALPLIAQVCAGVAEAHRNRVIHRDLKPDNIVIQDIDPTKDVNSKEPYLIGMNAVRVVDFGVAKMWSESGGSSASLTLEGKVCGSPAYMSPEQCKGSDIDYRSDIYSLGVVIFETFTGQRPFAANDLMALMLMHVNKEAPSIGAVLPDATFPLGLSAVVVKALSKDPKDRQQSAEELWAELDAVCRGNNQRPEEITTEEWIPFDAKATLMQNRPQMSENGSFFLAEAAKEWTKSTAEMYALQNKNKKFKLGWGQIKLGLFVCVLVVSVFSVGKIYMKASDISSARSLLSSGNFEGSIQILEGLNQRSALIGGDRELLNEAYLKLAKRHYEMQSYQTAIDLLDRINDKSKFYKEAQSLLKQYKRRSRR